MTSQAEKHIIWCITCLYNVYMIIRYFTPGMMAAILNLALKRKAQGEILETLMFLALQTSNYLCTKIQLSTFFFQVEPNFDLMLLGYKTKTEKEKP